LQRETLQKHVRQPKKGCIIFGQTQTNMIIMIIMSVVITLRVSDHHLYHEWQWLAVNTPLWLHQLPKMGVQQNIILCSKIRANNYTKSASWVPVAFPEVCVHRKKVIMSPKPARCIANQTRWPRKERYLNSGSVASNQRHVHDEEAKQTECKCQIQHCDQQPYLFSAVATKYLQVI
jgi:hypothetical protein